jgi:Cobalamin biosynthesis protein CobN and related Mg-chelatases
MTSLIKVVANIGWVMGLVLLSSWSMADEKILFVSGSHSNKAKVTILKDLAKSQNIIIEQMAESALGEKEDVKRFLENYDLTVFDTVSERSTRSTFLKYAPIVQQASTKIVAVRAPSLGELRANMSEQQAKTLFDYYDNGGVENFNRLVQYLRHALFDNRDIALEPPIIFPAQGIYHPQYSQLIFDGRAAYDQWLAESTDESTKQADEKGIRIGVMLQRALIESAQTEVVDATIALLEARGINVVPFYFELSPRSKDYSALLQDNGVTTVDAIINFRSIHWANKRKAEFEKLGVPVMQALTYYDGDQQAWEESKQGISAGMMAFTLVLPETAGVIDPVIVAAIDQTTHRATAIDYQLEHLVSRAINYAALAHLPNKDKKLTVLFWGDRDMGASFLNIPESLRTVGTALNKAGYNIEAKPGEFYIERVNKVLDPFYREYELDKLLEQDLAELFPVARYQDWLATLPAGTTTPITEFWGEPDDNFMVVERAGEKYFVIPRIRNGNMLIMRQPPRGDDAEQEQGLFHKTTIPMNHYYLAAYFYAREVWGSDAFIHLGTHGSQEYLPGKERGLSRYDGGNLAVGDVPVMYPFIVDDVGEAMQTKRRGSAVVVSHMTPPYAAAGLQGVTADIHALMHEYKSMDEGAVKQKTGDNITSVCIEKDLCKDIGWTLEAIQADFEGFLAVLHTYLGELAAENQPLGLHSFGELPEVRLQASTLGQMLGREFTALAAEYEAEHYAPDKHEHLDETHGEHAHGSDVAVDEDDAHHAFFQNSETPVERLPGYRVVTDFVMTNSDISPLPEALQTHVLKGREYFANMQSIQELPNTLRGLSGGYIAVKTGGDPVRHPDSLPTGLNLYGFDPSRLPTRAAFDQGKVLVEQAINDYREQHGEFPDKLAFSLWSIEAMRHYGVLESQALYAMGVKPVWSDDGRVVDTEIIPASELGRPRVDVVLSATGLYRDAFPNVMQRLANAIKQVAELKEAGNSLWDNSQTIKAQLMEEGVDVAEAQYLSTVRIFSNASGDYGSGVDGPIFESESWETDAVIADTYLSKMGYYFGADSDRWGRQMEGLYGKQLSGTDIALFSRSSNLYGMITSDDPFEYFGSLALAVRNLDGKSPEMLISNLRDAKNSKLESAAKFMAKELRSRNFNSRWIEEMQKEGYSGAVTMASNLANFWGWQVVDPNVVRDDQWQDFFEIYVEDRLELDMDTFFEQSNPAAQAQMIETLLESTRKEYWDASDATVEVLIERYQTLVNRYDLVVDNDKLREFVGEKAAGFGLSVSLPAPEAPAKSVPPVQAEQMQQIQGQQLQKVEPTSEASEPDNTLWWVALVCCLLMIGGMGWQAIPRRGVAAKGLS